MAVKCSCVMHVRPTLSALRRRRAPDRISDLWGDSEHCFLTVLLTGCLYEIEGCDGCDAESPAEPTQTTTTTPSVGNPETCTVLEWTRTTQYDCDRWGGGLHRHWRFTNNCSRAANPHWSDNSLNDPTTRLAAREYDLLHSNIDPGRTYSDEVSCAREPEIRWCVEWNGPGKGEDGTSRATIAKILREPAPAAELAPAPVPEPAAYASTAR